ncbi:MAG: DMT family transporter [Bacillota bacterium]|nr:DMT family transporter [Bacillota bacterium]
MKINLFAILMAALAGSVMAIQGTINAALGKIVGLLEATLIVMVIGVITALVVLYPLGLGKGSMGKISEAPWFTFLGGLLIVIITYAVAASIPRVGVATATTAIVAAQVSTAVIIDHFGLFGMEAIPFSWWKILGLVLLAAGTRIMLISSM